jgi:hypothetical protein
MKDLSAFKWLGALALLLCIVVVAIASGGRITISTIRSPTARFPLEGTGELVASARVCQTFVAQYDGLSQVLVMLDDLGHENSAPFLFYLRHTPDVSEARDAAEDLVSLTHDALGVENQVHHIFEFPPLRDSAGQPYAFCLEAPEAPLDSSITVIGVLDDWYPEGKALFRDMWGRSAGVQDLDFYLGYRLSWGDTLRVLSERLAANKPYLCGTRWFYALLGTAYLVLLYALFAKVIPPSGADKQG